MAIILEKPLGGKNLNPDNSYRLVIKTILNGEETLIEFDRIDPPTFNDNSEITSQPMVSGDVVSDHMFRQPQTVSISGSFGIMGNRPTIFYGPNDRLTNIEETFTKIKNEGVFCTLTTLSRKDNAESRYMTRKNMVLYSISWTENQSSVDFRFDFKEVLLATINVASLLYDVTDDNLPSLVDAKRLNFTDTLMDMNDVYKYVIGKLCEVGLVTEEFLIQLGQKLDQYSKEHDITYNITNVGKVLAANAIGSTVGLVVGIIIIKTIIGVGAAIPVWGWIVAGIAAAIGGIISLGTAIARYRKQKEFGTSKFKIYKDASKQDNENERFLNYIGNIGKQLTMLNDVIDVYGCSEDGNQQCIIEIDGDYYNFKFVRNNINKYYDLTIEDMQETVINSQNQITGLKTLDECATTKPLIETSSGFTVFLVNASAQNAIDTGKTQEEIDAINKDLKNYYIIVCSIDMKKYNETLQQLVINQMTVGA